MVKVFFKELKNFFSQYSVVSHHFLVTQIFKYIYY